MLGLIQLVSHANVRVENHEVGAIQQGILALIGLEKTDTERTAEKMVNRILGYRVFHDKDGKTNLSLQDINGGLLLVPQFTLVAVTDKGTRPGFSKGMPPEQGKQLFDHLVRYAKNTHACTETGQYGAYMQVSLCNDGPATFILKS